MCQKPMHRKNSINNTRTGSLFVVYTNFTEETTNVFLIIIINVIFDQLKIENVMYIMKHSYNIMLF